MDTVIPSLYASAPEPLGFGPNLEIRAFLLQRPEGNLLVYRSAALTHQAATLTTLGGISRQYLNHWHEAAPICDWINHTFDAPLHCQTADAANAAKTCTVNHTFTDRHTLDNDFEIIPTPGHTPGATAYLWTTDQHRCLFTGDTLFLSSGTLVAAVLENSDRPTYLNSLQLLRELDFDLLLPAITSNGHPYHATLNHTQATRQIDTIIHRVRNGENH